MGRPIALLSCCQHYGQRPILHNARESKALAYYCAWCGVGNTAVLQPGIFTSRTLKKLIVSRVDWFGGMVGGFHNEWITPGPRLDHRADATVSSVSAFHKLIDAKVSFPQSGTK